MKLIPNLILNYYICFYCFFAYFPSLLWFKFSIFILMEILREIRI